MVLKKARFAFERLFKNQFRMLKLRPLSSQKLQVFYKIMMKNLQRILTVTYILSYAAVQKSEINDLWLKVIDRHLTPESVRQ